MRSSASQTLLPATQRRCTETVAAMARRKRRLAPQRNHTDSVITFYNRDTEKARDKMGNKTKKFRQISTNVHRTGHRGKNKRRRSATRGHEKAGQILEEVSCYARTAKNSDARLRCLTRSSAMPCVGGTKVGQKSSKNTETP